MEVVPHALVHLPQRVRRGFYSVENYPVISVIKNYRVIKITKSFYKTIFTLGRGSRTLFQSIYLYLVVSRCLAAHSVAHSL